MKIIASLFVAAFAGYAWAHEAFLTAIFSFLIAFGLTEIPTRISAALSRMYSYVWRGISSWDRKWRNRLDIALVLVLFVSIFVVFEVVDRIIDVEQAFGSFGEFGAVVLFLAISWIAAGITVLVLVSIGVAATIRYDRRRDVAPDRKRTGLHRR